MTTDNPRRGPVGIAALTASLLVLVLGLLYRVLEARLLTPVSTTPIDAQALDPFPTQLADWSGEDVPLDEAAIIMDKISAEASINRCYSRSSGAESVGLFIAASGVTAGTLVGHPPEICNVWSGYTLADERSVELPLTDATNLPCRVLQFARGGSLPPEKKTVLYYYLAGSEFCGNRSSLRSRVRRGNSIVHCVGQIQIIASSLGPSPADAATQLVCDFAADSAAAVAELFRQVEKDQSLNSSSVMQEGGSR